MKKLLSIFLFLISFHGIAQTIIHTDSAGALIAPSLNNVKAFGAVGDGVTDDYASLQAALNAGGSIWFGYNRIYYLSAPLLINNSGTHVHLNGSSILCSSTSSAFVNGAIGTSNTSVKYQDLSPTINLVGGSAYFIYSGVSNLSKGDVIQISGLAYDSVSPGYKYNYGVISPISRINSDTVFLSVAPDTTYSAISLYDYTGLSDISVDGGTIIANYNNNFNGTGVQLNYCTRGSVNNMSIKGQYSFQSGALLNGCYQSEINKCYIDSCVSYGASVQGNFITVSDCNIGYCNVHDIRAGQLQYNCTNILYWHNSCNGNTSPVGGTIPLDMHPNTSHSKMEWNTVYASQTALQIRGKYIDAENNTLWIDNTVAGHATLDAIYCWETFNGNCNIDGNEVHVAPGSATTVVGLSFQGSIQAASNMNVYNNKLYNGSAITNTQPINNSNFYNNYLLADTLQYNYMGLSAITNSNIYNNTIQDRTLTGFSYGLSIANSSQTIGSIYNNKFFVVYKTSSAIRLSSTTTGFLIGGNTFFTTSTGSIILDNSTGLQNPQVNNYKVDSLGNYTEMAYGTAPTASQLFEGKLIQIVVGSTTIPNVCEKTGTGAWTFVPISAAVSSPWQLGGTYGNYITQINTADSVYVGGTIPTAKFEVAGNSLFQGGSISNNGALLGNYTPTMSAAISEGPSQTINSASFNYTYTRTFTLSSASSGAVVYQPWAANVVNQDLGASSVYYDNVTMRQQGGSLAQLFAHKVDYVISAGDSLKLAPGYQYDVASQSGHLSAATAFPIIGSGTVTGIDTVTGISMSDFTPTGGSATLVTPLWSSVANGTGKYLFDGTGGADGFTTGGIFTGNVQPDGINKLRSHGQFQVDSLAKFGGELIIQPGAYATFNDSLAAIYVLTSSKVSNPAGSMTRPQINAITSPTNGGLVYDRINHDYMFYNPGLALFDPILDSANASSQYIKNTTIAQTGNENLTQSATNSTTGGQTIVSANNFLWSSVTTPTAGSEFGNFNTTTQTLNAAETFAASLVFGSQFNRLTLQSTNNSVITMTAGTSSPSPMSAMRAQVYMPQSTATTTTVSDVAGLTIGSPYQDAGTTASVKATNYYSLLLQAGTDNLVTTPITNFYGIYQAGTGDKNVLKGPLAYTNEYGTSATPGIAAGTGAGGSPTVSISGTNNGGTVNVTTGSAPTASGTVATITFSGSFAFPTGCSVILYPRNAATALLTGTSATFTQGSTGTWTMTAGTVALTTLTAYSWNYEVIGY